MRHKIRQKASSGFANAYCKRTEFFQVYSSEKQTYNTDMKYDTFKQHYERQWDLYDNVTSFNFFSSYYHLVYLQVLPPVPHWNVAQCHKFNSEAIFPDYLTKDFTWMSDYFSYWWRIIAMYMHGEFVETRTVKILYSSAEFLGQGPVWFCLLQIQHTGTSDTAWECST